MPDGNLLCKSSKPENVLTLFLYWIDFHLSAAFSTPSNNVWKTTRISICASGNYLLSLFLKLDLTHLTIFPILKNNGKTPM